MTRTVEWRRLRNGKILVEEVKVRPGDSVAWNTKGTSKPIGLFFPDARLFGTHQDFVLPGRTKTKKVLTCARSNAQTVYPYAIYFVEWGRFGEGSSPIIIVKK